MGKVVIALCILVIVAIAIIGVVLEQRWNTAPVISVNYCEALNQMRKPAGYDPNEDGTYLWEKAMSLLEHSGRIRKVAPGETLSRWQTTQNDIAVTADWPSDMNSTELAAVKQWLATNSEAIVFLKQAQTKTQFWPMMPVSSEPLWEIPYRQSVGILNGADALLWEGKIGVAEGRTRPGLEDIFRAAMIGKCFGGKPLEFEQRIRMSNTMRSYRALAEVLAHLKLSDEDLRWLIGRVEEIDSISIAREVAQASDDCFIRDVIQRFFSDDGKGDGILLAGCIYEEAARDNTPFNFPWRGDRNERRSAGAVMSAMSFSMRNEGRKATLTRVQKLSEIGAKLCEIPPYKPEFGELKDEYAQCSLENPFLHVIGLSVSNANWQAMSYHRYLNHGPGLLTVIAVIRYKADKAKLPETLSALLENGYLKELPIDRFSGQPFVYRIVDGDFTLYSVSENGKDDGGTRTDKLDDVFWPVDDP